MSNSELLARRNSTKLRLQSDAFAHERSRTFCLQRIRCCSRTENKLFLRSRENLGNLVTAGAWRNIFLCPKKVKQKPSVGVHLQLRLKAPTLPRPTKLFFSPALRPSSMKGMKHWLVHRLAPARCSLGHKTLYFLKEKCTAQLLHSCFFWSSLGWNRTSFQHFQSIV